MKESQERQATNQANTQKMPKQLLEWVECPSCKQEVSYLERMGTLLSTCNDCHEAKIRNYNLQAGLKSVLDSKKALKEFTFDGFSTVAGTLYAYEICESFVPDKDNLYIWGPCGTGKSHLAYATVRENVLSGKSAEIISPPKMMRMLRALKPDAEQEILVRLQSRDVVMIDDLGVGKSTEFALTVLYEIVSTREMNYKNGLIITSNLSLEDLARKLDDDRLPSRLAGMCKQIKVDAQDWRLRDKLIK